MMVMTCIDRFSKIVQLVLLQEFDVCTIANKFLSMVVSWHGLPKCIISDHDPHFCAHFWDSLMFLLEITFTFSVALHPQTDRMAEVTNCTMEKLLWIHA